MELFSKHMRIEQIKIANFRVFRSLQLRNLPGMSVLVGANGTGKTTFFDVFGFIKDALKDNVNKALAKRGGFKEVVSRGTEGPIILEFKYREKEGPLVTYHLAIGLDNGKPVVERELLKYRRGQKGKPWHFLDFRCGQGRAIINEEDYGKTGVSEQREDQTLGAPDLLAIKGLGQFRRFQAASNFRELIESWHLSDFRIQDARPSQEAGYAEHLSPHGENLPLVTQYVYEHHSDTFDKILRVMEKRVPGVCRVQASDTIDGRVVLRFQDGAFKDPFIARHVSDGTIKLFAYLVLLYDPSPHPLLCVEEPENHLYPQLLAELAEEFRSYAQRGGQLVISTHSPDFLNGVELNEVFWLEKVGGYTQIHRVGESALLQRLADEGDLPGALWKQDLFRVGVHGE